MHHNDIIAECLSHEAHNREGVAGCPPLSMPHVYIFIYLFIYIYIYVWIHGSQRQRTEFMKAHPMNGNKNCAICITDIV